MLWLGLLWFVVLWGASAIFSDALFKVVTIFLLYSLIAVFNAGKLLIYNHSKDDKNPKLEDGGPSARERERERTRKDMCMW